MPIKGSYTLLGLGLILMGVLLSFVSYFILTSTPLTALGMSTIILGIVSLALGKGHPEIPPEASALMWKSGLENISAIIEELGLRSKAVYLPSSWASGKPQALLPLHSNPHPPKPDKPLPKRLIVKYGSNPQDMGLLVTTPGSTIADTLRFKPTAMHGDLEAALSSVLTGMTNLADDVRVARNDDKVIIEVSNPRLDSKDMWIDECLGSPLASIVASMSAEALNKPVAIEREGCEKGKYTIELSVLE